MPRKIRLPSVRREIHQQSVEAIYFDIRVPSREHLVHHRHAFFHRKKRLFRLVPENRDDQPVYQPAFP